MDLEQALAQKRLLMRPLKPWKRRKEQLTKILEQMNASLTKYIQGMQRLESEAVKLQQPSQA